MMKRVAPPAATSERSSLQQPVSCQLCRTRKLKCDRRHPCFNCSSRNFECLYASDQRQNFQSPARGHGTELGTNPCAESNFTNLAQRIRRLEAAVFRNEDSQGLDNVPSTGRFTASSGSPNPRLPNQERSSTPAACCKTLDEEQQKTSEWLEGLISDPHVICTSDTVAISPDRAQISSINTVDLSIILREFPNYNDAEMLLGHFTKSVDAMYRILHVPTTKRLLKDLYSDLNANRLPSTTQLAFFLVIFAGSAYVSKGDLQIRSTNLNGRPPIVLAETWCKQAVLLLTKPPVPPSTQALQAFSHIAHLCTQIEGFSGSFGVLSMAGIQMTKMIKIHRLDTPRYREERQKNGADMVDIEVKRRVWWHMVSSDWLLSNVSGPNEGTYFLHPRQMETSHPSNVEDDDIPTGITHVTEGAYNLPLSSPTSMSYFLFRIQCATLSREVVDLLPPSYCVSPGTNNNNETFNNILLLDQKYQQLLKSLPPFFQLFNRMDTNAYNALIAEKPYLEWQRYLINFVIHTNLARLHRPFLIRGSTQPKFAYSRLQCVRSAVTVLEIRNHIIGNQSIGGFTYIMAHFLMAAIILAMDVCFNPDEIRASQRKQEVLQACRILEEELNTKMRPKNEAENGSSPSGHFMLKSFQKAVQSLRGVLRRKQTATTGTGTALAEVNQDPTSSVNQVNDASDKGMASLPKRWKGVGNQAAVNNDGIVYVTDMGDYQPQTEISAQLDQPIPQDNDTQSQDTIQQTPFPPHPPYGEQSYDLAEQGQASGELTVDVLWDEFFTVGTSFDDSDWDTFLIDLDEQMGGVGSGS